MGLLAALLLATATVVVQGARVKQQGKMEPSRQPHESGLEWALKLPVKNPKPLIGIMTQPCGLRLRLVVL
jgi:hypothetical protein